MQLSEARHAFVTGGASGIGLGIAGALADRGIPVTLADINEESLAQVVATRADSDPDSFDRIIAINLTGVYNGIWAFAEDMAGRGRGHIVCTSSQAGLT